MDLNEREKGILRRIVTDDAYELLRAIGNSLVVKWNATNIDEETEFLTAKRAIERQERKNGIDLFLKTIEELCHDR